MLKRLLSIIICISIILSAIVPAYASVYDGNSGVNAVGVGSSSFQMAVFR